MSIITNFGISDGKQVYLFTLDNGKGLRAEITNFGGIIKSLVYKGTDVVLGRDTLEEYYNNIGFFGALIGRNSNRIEGAGFTLNGKEYRLFANDRKNNLHGGICLETQAFPNSLKYAHYPNGILKKGENYKTVTEYRFI